MEHQMIEYLVALLLVIIIVWGWVQAIRAAIHDWENPPSTMYIILCALSMGFMSTLTYVVVVILKAVYSL